MEDKLNRRDFLKIGGSISASLLPLWDIGKVERNLSTDYSHFFTDKEVDSLGIAQYESDYSSFRAGCVLGEGCDTVEIFGGALGLNSEKLEGATLRWTVEQDHLDFEKQFIDRSLPSSEMMSLTLPSGEGYVFHYDNLTGVRIQDVQSIFPHWDNDLTIEDIVCLKGGIVAHKIWGLEDERVHYEYSIFRGGNYYEIDLANDTKDSFHLISNSHNLLKCEYKGDNCVVSVLGNYNYQEIHLNNVAKFGGLHGNTIWQYRNCVGALCYNQENDASRGLEYVVSDGSKTTRRLLEVPMIKMMRLMGNLNWAEGELGQVNFLNYSDLTELRTNGARYRGGNLPIGLLSLKVHDEYGWTSEYPWVTIAVGSRGQLALAEDINSVEGIMSIPTPDLIPWDIEKVIV